MITYDGPERFRKSISDSYDRISSDYNRQNTKVKVGFRMFAPHISEATLYYAMGFRSRGHYFLEFEKMISELIRDMKKVIQKDKDPLSLKEQMVKIEDIGLTRFLKYLRIDPSIDKDQYTGAFYMLDEDCIYIYPYVALLHFINPNRDQVEEHKRLGRLATGEIISKDMINLNNLLRHELVHYDFGDTQPNLEVRQSLSKYLYYMKRFDSIYTKAVDKETRKFLRTVPQDCNAMMFAHNEAGKSVLESQPILKRIMNLKIKNIEEALSCVSFGGQEGYKAYADGNNIDNFEASSIYSLMERMVRTHGKRDAIRIVKEKANESWGTNTELTKLLEALV